MPNFRNLMSGEVPSSAVALVEVENSALFNSANSEDLSRGSMSGTATTWTASFWVYRGVQGGTTAKFMFTTSSDGGLAFASNSTADILSWYSGSYTATTSVFRDIGWYHMVVKSVAGSGTVYVNGESVLSGLTVNGADATMAIGSYNNGSNHFDGYMAEWVFIDGTAYNPTSFAEYDTTGLYWTPKSSDDIQELTFGNNGFYFTNETVLSGDMTTFVDSGPTAHTITTVNDATHSPLGHKVQNSVIYVDGTDWIKTAPSGHADFTLGTGDFCIEGWFNRTAISGTDYVFDFRYSGNNTARPAVYMGGSNQINYDLNGIKITGSTNPTTGEWFHLAIARNGSTTTMYLDGTSVGSFTDTVDYLVGRPFFFQYPQAYSYGFTGYATELRISKGVPRYTANFTPSTTAFVSDSYTSLLVHSDKFFGAGDDVSGNFNNFTNNNTVVTTTHTPTNSHCTMSPLHHNPASTLSNGNRTINDLSASWRVTLGTLPIPPSGKWYWEMTFSTGSSDGMTFGVCEVDFNAALAASTNNNAWAYSTYGSFYSGGSSASYGDVPVNTDTIGVSMNMDTGDLTFYVDNVSQGVAVGSLTGSKLVYANLYDSWVPTFHFEEADWTYTPPTGHVALNTTNIAAATTRTASDTNKYFQTTLYEGNGAGQRVGAFQPFDNTFTVGNSALFNDPTVKNRSLSRSQTAGSNTVWTASAWLKKTGFLNTVWLNFGTGSTQGQLGFHPTGEMYIYNGSSSAGSIKSTEKFLDSSVFHHYHIMWNSGASGTDKLQIAVDGVPMTFFLTDGRSSASAFQGANQNGQTVLIGDNATNTDDIYFNGYMSEFVLLDGTASAYTNFGQVDTSTNRWVPKDVSGLDYTGANSTYLNFAASGDLGNDASPSGTIDYTNNNSVVSSTDSPTTNFAVLDPNNSGGGTISNGSKTLTTGASDQSTKATIRLPNTGKYYWESNLNVASSGSIGHVIFLSKSTQALTTGNGAWTDTILLNRSSGGSVRLNGTDIFTIAGTASINDKYQVAVDLDNNKMWFGINNSWFNATGGTDGNPSTGANAMAAVDFSEYYPMFGNYNTNQTVRFDSADWTYSAPTGFVALEQDNLAGTDQFISAFSWIKNRDAEDNHMLFDRVRGATIDWHSNATAAQATNANTVQKFLEAGVQVGSDVEVNTANESYVLWNWMMEATGTGSSNTEGTINTTSTLVDQTLGMSISTFTGASVNGAGTTIGHGLDVAPEVIILKNLSYAGSAAVYHSGAWQSASAPKVLYLNGTAAGSNDTNVWGTSGAVTPTTFTVGNWRGTNTASELFVAYCFAPSQFISIGSYEGNSNPSGTFIPTLNSLGVPIQPVWWLHKCIDTGLSWYILDSVSQTYNVLGPQVLSPDTTEATPSTTATYREADFVTGGVKIRGAGDQINNSNTHIYMAIGTPIIDVDGRIIAGK